MKQSFLTKSTPHLVALGVIFLIIFLYFMPLFQGKVLKQYDVMQWQSTYQEIAQFEKKTGERTFWTNSIFSGMPTYLIGASYKGNFTGDISYYISSILKHPADTIFLLFICFYILLLTFGVSPWLAIAGSLAFTFSSFNFINIDAGHITKGNAIAFMPLVLAGINITLRKNRLLGALITGIAVSLELAAGHLQITYYLIFIILAWMITELVIAIRQKTVMHLLLCGIYLAVAGVIAIGTGATGLMATKEYEPYSLRGGKSELTKTANGQSNEENSSSGLDKDYALAWSNGVAEPFTLLIPNFYGGASNGELSTSGETYQLLKQNGVPNPKEVIKQMPVYWGDQPFTQGPTYYGAIIVFLFVMGMFLVKGPQKWWIFIAAMLAIFLSMGKHFMPLTDIFFNYFPLYNKFRSVTFILCIAQTLFPLLAILALQEVINGKHTAKEIMAALLKSLYVVGGICLIFLLIPGVFFDFSSQVDVNLPEWLKPALITDRESLMRMDSFRSLVFILITAGLIWYYTKGKIRDTYFMAALALIITADLWQVDKRYLNDRDFVKKKGETIIEKTPVDEQILQDTDIHYRVYNNTVDFDKDALTAYYHKTVGGYHGAKMRRYQELIEWHLGRRNIECFSMLNVKYFIVGDSTGQKFVQQNPDRNGNAWFVKEIKWVNDADEEINALTGFHSKETAVVDKRFGEVAAGSGPLASFKPEFDSTASIKLLSYAPNKLVYESNASKPQLTVFSEIFYDKGWNAYVNGSLQPHFRADYVLRAMIVPAGKNTIEFKFEPAVVKTGETISYASSIVLYGGLVVILAMNYFRKKKDEKAEAA